MLSRIETPASIIAQFLEDENLAGEGTNYPVQVGFLDNVDKAVVCNDYGAKPEGRLMIGIRIKKPLIQIRVRTTDYPEGYQLLDKIDEALSAIKEADNYILDTFDKPVQICGFKVLSGPMFIGRDDKSERSNFSLNGSVTLKYPS